MGREPSSLRRGLIYGMIAGAAAAALPGASGMVPLWFWIEHWDLSQPGPWPASERLAGLMAVTAMI